MLKNTHTYKNQKGFTLIEVVLVLAIGGLIFLLAFLAFQQVSTNRRDTQRRSDAARILAELANYTGDTKGLVYTSDVATGSTTAGTGVCTTGGANTAAAFTTAYLCKDGKFFSPSGKNYNTVSLTGTDPLTTDQIKISLTYPGVLVSNDCNGTALPPGGYKVEIGLEKGVACRDNK